MGAIGGFFFLTSSDNQSSLVKGLFTKSPQETAITPQPTEAPKDTKPSERALKAAIYFPKIIGSIEWQNWIIEYFSDDPPQFIDQFRTSAKQQGYSDAEIEAEIKRHQEEKAITNYALYLDSNTNELITLELKIEQDKSRRSQPQVYVERPAQIQNLPPLRLPDHSYDDLKSQVSQQEQQLRQLQWEQQQRELWEGVCARRGEQYNSLVGAGCR